jgi:hypothetical protein
LLTGKQNEAWVLVAYHFPPHTAKRDIVRFRARFFGRRVTVHAGRYSYEYPGFLGGIPHEHPQQGVVRIRMQDVAAVRAFLRREGALLPGDTAR